MESSFSKTTKITKQMKMLYIGDDLSTQDELEICFMDIFEEVEYLNPNEPYTELINQKKIAIILLDIKDFDIESLKELKEIDIPILSLVGKNQDTFFKLLNFGLHNFIAKPIKQETLLKTVFELLEKEYQKREIEKLNSHLQKDIYSHIHQDVLLHEYQDAIDKSSIIAKTDINGIITYVNSNFINATGYDKKDVIGKDRKDILDTLISTPLLQDMHQSILNKMIWQGAIGIKRKDLKQLYTFASIVPILDQNDNIIECLNIIQNISFLHELEQKKLSQIAQQASRFHDKNMLDLIPTSALVVDNEMNILSYNKIFKDLCNKLPDPNTLIKLNEKNPYLFDILTPSHQEDISKLNDTISFYQMGDVVSYNLDIKLTHTQCNALCKIKRKDKDSFIVLIVFTQEEKCFQV